MRILIAADIFPPDSGGPATYSYNLAEALRSRGHLVRLVSLNTIGVEISGVTRHVTKQNKFLRYVEYFILLMKYGRNSDVIYAMGPVNAGLPALICAKILRKRLIVKVVGDYAWEQGVQRFGTLYDIDNFQNKKLRHSLPVYILRWIQSLVVRQSARVIVPSRYLKKIIIGWGANSEKVEVVYNAVKIENIEAAEKSENEKWLVSVCRLTPWKGIEVLIAIMPDLLKNFPNLKLKIIGDGPEKENLIKLSRESGMEDKVDFIGSVSHKEALGYIKSADVFVLNSAYEGLSHVILEALTQKIPVAASKRGGNTELLQGGWGELFEYNNFEEIRNRIAIILENLTKYRENYESDEYKEFIKKFEYEEMVGRVINFFRTGN